MGLQCMLAIRQSKVGIKTRSKDSISSSEMDQVNMTLR